MALLRRAVGRVVPILAKATGRLPRPDRRTAVASALGAALVLTGSAAATNAWIDLGAAPYIYPSIEEVPPRPVAIVPGARVYTDGEPSPALADRLAAARELHQRGKVGKILVSGDHRAPEYDETNAMWRWLTARGVPSAHVFLDHAGLRTLDTMERARRVFGVTEAIVCTQGFHLPRSVFLARRAGIDAVGIKADRRAYKKWVRNHLREFFAKSVSFVDSYWLGTDPHHLGDPIPIDGDSLATHDRWTKSAD
jgi:SanA protein